MSKNASKKSAANKAADWDLDEVLSVEEFFDLHEITPDQQAYKCKECTAEDGSTFFALGLANGKTYYDKKAKQDKPAMTFFALGNKIEIDAENEEEFEDWVAENASNLALLEPPSEDVKYGKLFLAGKRKLWSQLVK